VESIRLLKQSRGWIIASGIGGFLLHPLKNSAKHLSQISKFSNTELAL